MWISAILALSIASAPGNISMQGRTKTGAPDNIPHKDVPSDSVEGRRYVGGGITVTTHSYWAHVTSGEYPFKATCVLACNGKKHLSHQQCDTTCDSACTALHQHTFTPEFEFETAPGGGAPSWEAGVAKEIAKAGGRASQAGPLANQVRDAAMKPIQDHVSEYTYTYKSGHWNDKPCSSQSRTFHYSLYSLFCAYSVVKDGRLLANATSLVGTIKIPHQAFHEEDPVESCACQIVPEQRRAIDTKGLLIPNPTGTWTHGMMLPNPQPGKGYKVGGLVIDNEGDGKYCAVPGGDASKFGVTTRIQAKDLNNFSLETTNATGQLVSMGLLPGTTFKPDSGGFQSMVNLDFLQWDIPPNSTAEIIVRHGPSVVDAVEGYMACLDMAKKQPDGKVGYSLVATTDPTILDLGFAISQQRFRGPWNQAQLWAYRDGASIDQINERLGIGVSTSHYLVGIYELAHLYGVPLDEAKYKGVWDPKLLLAHAAEAGQIEWLVDGLTRHDAKGLAAWVRKNVGAFAPLFEPGGQEWYVPHAAHVATSLCHASNADVQAAGLEFLEKGVPVAARARMLEAGGLDGLVQLAWGDGPNQKRALAIAEMFDPALAKDLKTPPDPNAPMPEVKPPPQRHRASSKSFP
ncbi:MAG: hypothetical protein M9921_09155 [Fimbriimonadaceae bacterium]|nr:hypothetical protein [Fimbriimonadaceae bacterium]